MNLQVCVPDSPCMFKCPFCISHNRNRQNYFENRTNESSFYFAALSDAIQKYNIETVVITGSTEPTQHPAFIRAVGKYIKTYYPNVKVELQTHMVYAMSLDYKYIDVYAFSVYTSNQIDNAIKVCIPMTAKKRVVVLVNDQLKLDPVQLSKFDQVTVKQLQYGDDMKVNKWIAIHNNFHVETISQLFGKIPSLFIDLDCRKAEGRYLILRPDGKIYHDWAEAPRKK